jgi:formylmethanofuran dehydrogenase subunit E
MTLATLMNPVLGPYVQQLGLLHDHFCPRQVLGMRIGLQAAALLGAPAPQTDKRIIAFAETDGCFVDGASVVTGCTVGHRTLRIVDQGKIAVVFADTLTRQALRVWPHPGARRRAPEYAPDAPDTWHAYLYAYQVMPPEELLLWRPVDLLLSLDEVVGSPDTRAMCSLCGEEIINQREVYSAGKPRCRSCAGESFYAPAVTAPPDIPRRS